MRNLLALGFFTVFLVLLLSGVPQKITNQWFSNHSISEKLILGKLTPLSGVVLYDNEEVKNTINIGFNKPLSTSPNAKLEINLSKSDFKFSLISAKAVFKPFKDHILLILNSGQYIPLSGKTNKLKVLKNSRLYASDITLNKDLASYRPIIKDAISQAPLIVSEELSDIPQTVESHKSNKKLPESLESEPDNAFLDQVIANQSEKLQNCQVSRIRELGTVKGQVIVGLEIHPNGDIKNAKILDTDIEDTQLMNCLLSVFQRIKLPKYKGEIIYRSYPLLFE